MLSRPLLAATIGLVFLVILFWRWPDSVSDKEAKDPAGSQPVISSATESSAADFFSPGPLATLPPRHLPQTQTILIRFPESSSRENFLRNWNELHPGTSRTIPSLQAVRINLLSPESRRNLENLLPENADLLENTVFVLPTPPPREEQDSGSYRGFDEGIRSWLNISGEVENWGSGITVAILDSGLSHPTDHPHWRQIDLLENPTRSDSVSHGEAMARLIAGSDGLAPQTDILALRVLDEQGRGDAFTVAEGIIRAVDQGARILNLSLGSPQDHPLLREAVTYAHQRGAILIAAAGNDGREGLPYPAAYPEVLAVGAIDADRQHAGFSNRGNIDLAAPGVGVAFPLNSENRGMISGTSAAAPIVSGAIAALVSQPLGLTPQDAARLLQETADDAGPAGRDERWGQGVINLERALHHHIPGRHDVAIADLYLHEEPDPEGNYRLEVTVQNQGTAWADSLNLRIQVGDGPILQPRRPLSLEVGASSGFFISLSAGQLLRGGGITVRAMVENPSVDDIRPENNLKSARFSLE